MAVVQVTESGEAWETKFEARRTFYVVLDGTDTPAEAAHAARRANKDGTRVPREHESHPLDQWKKVASDGVRPDRVGGEGSLLWKVAVRYRNPEGSGSGDASSDPMEQAPRYRFGFEPREEPIDIDAAGHVIMNTASVTFDPPATAEMYDYVIWADVNRYQQPGALEEYQGTLNDDRVVIVGRGIDKGMGRVFVSAEQVRTGENIYYAYHFKFVVRRRHPKGTVHIHMGGGKWASTNANKSEYTWQTRRSNTGLVQLVDGERENILDDNGNPVNEPQMLDLDGTVRDPDKDPLWLMWQAKGLEFTDWSQLVPPRLH